LKEAKKGIKIGELSRLSGVSKQTIHYYQREGLLHPPTKTHPNVAYYDSSHVDRLALIKRLKEGRRLKLTEIKDHLAGNQEPYLEEEFITGALTREPPDGQRYSRARLQKETGLSTSEIRLLTKSGLLSPETEGGKETYGVADVETARSFKGILETGYSIDTAIETVIPYVEAFKAPARNEAKNLLQIPINDADSTLIASICRDADSHIERALLIARRRVIVEETARTVEELRRRATEIAGMYKDMTGSVYLSSGYYGPLKLSSVIRTFKERIDKEPGEILNYLMLLPIYVAKGDLGQMLLLSKKAVEVAPTNPWPLYYLGVVYCRNMRFKEALEVLSRSIELDDGFALARAWYGGAMLLAATQETELIEAFSLIRAGIEQIDLANRQENKSLFEELNIMGLTGKSLSLLPRFLGRHEEGLEILLSAEQLAKSEREKSEDPFFAAVLDLILLNIYRTLGGEYDVDGMMDERDRVWKEFLKIDPKNKFADTIRSRMSGET
jgi:DNA-binding transcriptional MerR regulator